MKTFLTLLFSIFTTLAFSQKVFTVDNFSNEYYGEVHITSSGDVYNKGWIAIYERKTKQRVIRVFSDEIVLELHEDKVIANIKSLGYGEQSLIMYDDFNFDGIKDFAISDGQNSCYHGPSFKIYLATKNEFIYNNDFTRLAQEYCGMFDIDAESKKIYTMTKSGCCWHEYSEFIVVDNKPKAIKVVTDEPDRIFSLTTEEVWNGEKMVKNTIRTLDLNQEGLEVFLSFNLPKNNKRVMLINVDNSALYYVLAKKDSTIEFAYPIKTDYKSPDFYFDRTTTNLSVTFKNNDATYKIYELQNEIGIKITFGGKTSLLIGDITTKKGSLDWLRKVMLDNVHY